jgi:hypothetical protein
MIRPLQPLRDKHWQGPRRKPAKAKDDPQSTIAALKRACAEIDSLKRRVAKLENGSMVVSPEEYPDLDIDLTTGQFIAKKARVAV